MPSIRPEQFASLQSASEQPLIEELVSFIREEQADLVEGFPDQLLQNMVQAGLQRARGWGLTDTESLFGFVGLMFSIAPNFDEQANINHQLLQGRGTPDERMAALIFNTTETDWEQAEANYNPDAWEPVTQQ